MRFLLHCFLLSMTLISCDAFLDEQPDDRIELDSLEKISELVGSSFPFASHAFTDWYTNLASSRVPGQDFIADYHMDYFRWDDTEWPWQDSPTYFWNSAYNGISAANHALVALEKFKESPLKEAVKGEALLWRAYHHFMLVNLFGKHYDQNTASTDLGVPYATEPEVEFVVQYPRNTVQEVYDLAERDLLEGLDLISDAFFTGTKKFRFNKRAALAFASRFFLFKGDYENCIAYGLQLLGQNPSILVRDLIQVYDVISAYDVLRAAYGDPFLDANILMSETFSWFQRDSWGYRLNRNELRALYTGPLNPTNSFDDSRVGEPGIWSLSNGGAVTPRFREYFSKETLSSNTGLGYKMSLLITGEEVVLNVAEAYLQLGNISSALEYLNYLAEKRYYGQIYDSDFQILRNHYNQPTDEEALLSTLLHERDKEFHMYGMRWFDIRRYNISITHDLYDFNSQEFVESFVLPADDLRRQLQIPQAAISLGMTPNPR